MVRAGRQAWSPAHMLQGAENLRIHQPDPHLPWPPTATHSHSHTHMNTHSHAVHTVIHVCMYTMYRYEHIQSYTCSHTHTYIHTLTYACTHIVYMYTHTQPHLHVLRITHTATLAHTQSYIHIQSQHTHTDTNPSHTYIMHAQPQTRVHTRTPHILGLGDLGLRSPWILGLWGI